MDDGRTPIDDDTGTAVPPAAAGSPPDPFTATSPAEFVTAMRALKEWSGLTYRQVQRRAEALGEVLPHSTVAAVLGRNNLPREALVTAFVRACGLDEATATAWRDTRKRLAAETARADAPTSGTPTGRAPGAAPDTGSTPQAEPTAELGTAPDAASDSGAEAGVASGSDLDPGIAPEPDPPIASSLRAALRATTEEAHPADNGPDWPDQRPDVRDGTDQDGVPLGVPASGRLATVAADRTTDRWVGMHRHDPADDVPRPAGIRWLVPPIMYRTGWASRVLAGVLVLVMATIATAVIVRAVRDSSQPPNEPDVEAEAPLDVPGPGATLPAPRPSTVPATPSRSASPGTTRTTRGTPSPTRSASTMPVTGRVRIKLGHTGLCVGEGPELYTTQTRIVLGQHPCSAASPPTILERVSGNVYLIKLDHPEYGIGCATVDEGARGDGLLLAGADCGAGRTDQRFTLEPLKQPPGGYRMRSVAGAGYCIGSYDARKDVGVQLIQTRCYGGLPQTFTFERR